MTRANNPKIERVAIAAYTIPTDAPEGDGTYTWDATTLVVAEVRAGGTRGIGYTYADTATVRLIRELLAPIVTGRDAMDVPGAWAAMVHAVRNLGRPGICSMAIAALDSALWDLKARILDLPLCLLLGRVRESVPVYGSGGFTTYSQQQLQDQVDGWVRQGIVRVKMKVGTQPDGDLDHVRQAREAIGPDAELYVDGNGAYNRKQALAFAEHVPALCAPASHRRSSVQRRRQPFPIITMSTALLVAPSCTCTPTTALAPSCAAACSN